MITLREYSPEDVSLLRHLSTQASIQKAMTLPAGDEQGLTAYIAAHHHDSAKMLTILNDETPVGIITLAWPHAMEIYELGYFLDEAVQRKGIMTFSLKACISALFQGTDCKRIQAFVECENTASRNVLKKCGFTEEGMMRQGLKRGAQLVDVSIFAALKSDHTPHASC